MPSNNQRNNELEFTPTFGTQHRVLDLYLFWNLQFSVTQFADFSDSFQRGKGNFRGGEARVKFCLTDMCI
jgi:hypothetical protein